MFLTDYNEPVIFSDKTNFIVLCCVAGVVALFVLFAFIKSAKEKSKTPGEPAAAPIAAAPAVPQTPSPITARVPAKGSQGDIDLYNVDDRTAALLMAIVADDLKAELNTLRFISIREVQ